VEKSISPFSVLFKQTGEMRRAGSGGDDNAKEQIRFYVDDGIWQKIEVEPMNVVLVNGEKRK